MDLDANKTEAGCLTMFALPFCGVGLFLAYHVIDQFGAGEADWQQSRLLLVPALVFGGAGFGLLIWSRVAAGKLAQRNRLKEAHPEQPWMWKPDWARGRIEGSSLTTMAVAWVMAFFFSLMSVPLLVLVPKEVVDKGNHPALLGLIFPVVSVGLLIWAIRATARWKKFGVSFFTPASMPGVGGGRLRGTIQCRLQSRPQSGVALTLTCVHRRRVSRGRSSSTHERILWQESGAVSREHLYPGPRGLAVPVDFHIPSECSETDESNPHNKTIWRLEVRAAVQGVDYQTQFEVPVFKTAASSLPRAR